MMRKHILVVGILILAGLLCFSQPALTSGEEDGILGIGDLSGKLIDWDTSFDIWHGEIAFNATVLLTNAGNNSIPVWWETPNSEDTLFVPGNWQSEIIVGGSYNFIKRDFGLFYIGY